MLRACCQNNKSSCAWSFFLSSIERKTSCSFGLYMCSARLQDKGGNFSVCCCSSWAIWKTVYLFRSPASLCAVSTILCNIRLLRGNSQTMLKSRRLLYWDNSYFSYLGAVKQNHKGNMEIMSIFFCTAGSFAKHTTVLQF